MTRFLSCDWGTSFLRLRLADAGTDNLTVLAEENAPKGIAAVFNLWKEVKDDDPQKRLSFYLGILREHIKKMENTMTGSLDGIPLIISGMASSSIGMMQLPYSPLPFATDGSSAITAYIDSNGGFEHPVLLISGVRTANDVMRGEETQLVGCMSFVEEAAGNRIFIFPGTHSKHITVSGNQVAALKTYMTGEFFDLLSKKSILNAGLETHKDIQAANYVQSFAQGVKDAVNSNLLHTSFSVRTNDLFNTLTKKENYNYLSGLLIGTELQDLLLTNPASVFVCCSAGLGAYYETACKVLGLAEKTHVFPAGLAAEAVIKGQFKIFNQFKN
jgi:2-dehydro-3-deoxygalactonokinase